MEEGGEGSGRVRTGGGKGGVFSRFLWVKKPHRESTHDHGTVGKEGSQDGSGGKNAPKRKSSISAKELESRTEKKRSTQRGGGANAISALLRRGATKGERRR